MQQHINHDTSTQAMTEVALGLSMAFFSLLILALFSIGAPEPIQKSETEPNTSSSLSKDSTLKLAGNNDNSPAPKTPKDQQQFAFYFNGQLYDEQLNRLSHQTLTQLDKQQPLILAVPDSLALVEIMAVRKQINHPNLSITMLNPKWQTQLEDMQ